MWITTGRCWTSSGDPAFGRGRSGSLGSRVASATASTRLTWRAFGYWWCSWRSSTTAPGAFRTTWWTTSWASCQGESQNQINWWFFNWTELSSSSHVWQALACIFVAFIYWIFICLAMRYTLKLLLMYKGWMYESRGSGSKVSVGTKLWGLLVKGKWICRLFSTLILTLNELRKSWRSLSFKVVII